MVTGTCFVRLSLRSEQGQPVQGDLFLSPDGRFLTRELFDLSIANDPNAINARADDLAAKGAPARGPANAPVTLVIFSDFQCVYCKAQSQVLTAATDSGVLRNVKVIFRHLPLPAHNWARISAIATACEASENEVAFWALHDYLFRQQNKLSSLNISAVIDGWVAENDPNSYRRFKICVERGKPSILEQDLHLANKYDVHATPTLFINGQRLDGETDIDTIKRTIEALSR